MREGLRAAHHVHAAVVELESTRSGRELLEVLRTAVDLALARRTVVRGEQHDRVVPLAELLEGRAQAPQALVDRLDHGRVDLHVAGEELLLHLGEVVPWLDVVVGLGVAGR